jgi:dGTPase
MAYLVEAADDICYTIIDFEDGINLGLIQEELALEYLINLVRDSINTKKYQLLSTTQDRLSYLRALAINTLINEVVALFMKHEESILEGKFSKALLDVCQYEAQIKDIIKVSIEKIYQSKEVIEKEISGYEVINQLLNSFTTTTLNVLNGKVSNYDSLILKILPKTLDINNGTVYENILAICHYISKLSDSNAILTYRKLKGFHI